MWGCVRSRSWNHISVLMFSMASSLLSVFTNWAMMDLFWPTTVWIYNSTASPFHQKKVKVAQSDSFQPHGLWPNRLLCPWKSPGKNTVVGCHSLLQGSSQSIDQTWVSHIAGGFCTIWAKVSSILGECNLGASTSEVPVFWRQVLEVWRFLLAIKDDLKFWTSAWPAKGRCASHAVQGCVHKQHLGSSPWMLPLQLLSLDWLPSKY